MFDSNCAENILKCVDGSYFTCNVSDLSILILCISNLICHQDCLRTWKQKWEKFVNLLMSGRYFIKRAKTWFRVSTCHNNLFSWLEFELLFATVMDKQYMCLGNFTLSVMSTMTVDTVDMYTVGLGFSQIVRKKLKDLSTENTTTCMN